MMGQVQSPFKEECYHEEKEEKFPLFEEDGYPSLCTIIKILTIWKVKMSNICLLMHYFKNHNWVLTIIRKNIIWKILILPTS